MEVNSHTKGFLRQRWVTHRINHYTWIGIALNVAEGITLIIFRMSYPLTLIARKKSDSNKDDFDIFCLTGQQSTICRFLLLFLLLLSYWCFTVYFSKIRLY